MNIMPMHEYTRKDRPWVIRLLRYLGYFIVVVATLSGIFSASTIVGSAVLNISGVDVGISLVLSIILCGFLGFILGLLLSAPLWGFAPYALT